VPELELALLIRAGLELSPGLIGLGIAFAAEVDLRCLGDWGASANETRSLPETGRLLLDMSKSSVIRPIRDLGKQAGSPK
jgi:hypothetical protein